MRVLAVALSMSMLRQRSTSEPAWLSFPLSAWSARKQAKVATSVRRRRSRSSPVAALVKVTTKSSSMVCSVSTSSLATSVVRA